MVDPKPEPSIEERKAMTLEERSAEQWQRRVPINHLDPSRVEAMREKAQRHIAARDEAAAR